VAPHLPVEVEQRIEHTRQATRCRLVVLRQRRHQAVPASLHQAAHDLPQLRTLGVHAVQLRERLLGPPREHVVEQPVQQPRVGDPQQRPRRVQGDRSRRKWNKLI